jgi:hypothetical protein
MADSRIENAKEKGREAASSAGQAFQEAKGAVKEGASNLGQQARDVASQAGSTAREYASKAGDKTEDALHSVGHGMSSLAGSIRHNAPEGGMLGSAAGTVAEQLDAGGRYLREHDLGDIGEDLSNVIRRHPIPSLLAVFGIGFLLGGALRR